MKIEQLADIVTMLAKNHPDADVVMVYRAKHGKGYSTVEKPITGYRAMNGSYVPDKIFLEVDHASSYGVEAQHDAD